MALVVQDPDDATGRDAIGLVVQPTDTPTGPTSSHQTPPPTGSAGTAIAWSAMIDDKEDANESLSLTWSSDLQGELVTDLAPMADGTASGEWTLIEGTHRLTLSARDSDDKTGADIVALLVQGPNRSPECAFTTPETGGASEAGAPLDLIATVSDQDQPVEELVVTWTSSLDGVLGTTSPSVDNTAAFSLSTLTDGLHKLTLEVQDELGATCTDTLDWTIGRPPSLTLITPADGSTVNEKEPTAFEATVVDDDHPESELVVTWSSDLDGELAVLTPDSGGSVGFATSGLTVGDHALTARVEDPDGLFRELRHVLTVNGLPSAPTIRIEPTSPKTNDSLKATIVTDGVDPEGAPVTYRWAWYSDGTLNTTHYQHRPTSRHKKDETWRVVVTPNDGKAMAHLAKIAPSS